MKKLLAIIAASTLALLSMGASAITANAAGEYKDATYEGNEYVMTDSGELFLAHDMTDYEAQQVRDAF